MEKYFRGFTIVHIPRAQNDEADRLAKAATPARCFLRGNLHTFDQGKEGKQNQCNLQRRLEGTDNGVPSGTLQTCRRSRREKTLSKSKRLCNSQGELYKSGVVSPWLKCIPVAQGVELLNEIHSGICGSHIRIRPLAAKAFRQGFF